MGRYITPDAVIVRLKGKVKVTHDPEREPDRMPMLLLNRLINEAEGQVEQDLSTRYAAPFRCRLGQGDFARLPERPTKEILRTLCELLSVIRVLETDFGSGSSVNGSQYADSCQKRYDTIIWGDERKPGLCTLRDGTFNTYRTPPLPGLESNYHVAGIDTGFAGHFSRSDGISHSDRNYAAEAISDPSETYYSGSISAPGDDEWYG